MRGWVETSGVWKGVLVIDQFSSPGGKGGLSFSSSIWKWVAMKNGTPGDIPAASRAIPGVTI